jgi:hypothetical protein
VIVPSIEDLSDLFFSQPVSIAEISVGQVLSPDQWPEGEVKLDSEVAGRRVSVCMRPADGRVTIQVFSPDLVAELILHDADKVTAEFKPHGVKALTIDINGDSVTVRLRPDISVHYGAPS